MKRRHGGWSFLSGGMHKRKRKRSMKGCGLPDRRGYSLSHVTPAGIYTFLSVPGWSGYKN